MPPKIVTLQQSGSTVTYVRGSDGRWVCMATGLPLEKTSPLSVTLDKLVAMH